MRRHADRGLTPVPTVVQVRMNAHTHTHLDLLAHNGVGVDDAHAARDDVERLAAAEIAAAGGGERERAVDERGFGGEDPRREGRRALHDGAREVALRPRRYEVQADARRARALAEQRDALRVAAEAAHVAMQPRECELLVPDARVAGCLVNLEEVEAERAHAVLHRGHDNVHLGRQVAPVVDGERRAPAQVPAAVDPHHDGHALRLWRRARQIVGRHPEVQVEAVLAELRVRVPHLHSCITHTRRTNAHTLTT